MKDEVTGNKNKTISTAYWSESTRKEEENGSNRNENKKLKRGEGWSEWGGEGGGEGGIRGSSFSLHQLVPFVPPFINSPCPIVRLSPISTFLFVLTTPTFASLWDDKGITSFLALFLFLRHHVKTGDFSSAFNFFFTPTSLGFHFLNDSRHQGKADC